MNSSKNRCEVAAMSEKTYVEDIDRSVYDIKNEEKWHALNFLRIVSKKV